MRLDRRLANLGYGSRKDVTRMLRAGRVTRLDGTPFARDATDPGEGVLVDGEPLDPRNL